MAYKKAVVFDLYGTLLYIGDESKPYARLFINLNLQKDTPKIAITESFESISKLVAKVKPDAKIDLSQYEDEVEREIKSASLYPETEKVLEDLKSRGVKLGLISNLATPYKRPFFELGLDAYFNKAIFSCDAGLRKPDSSIYKMMLNELSINPQSVLMVGDNVRADVEGPKSVGIDAVHLDRKNGSSGSICTLEGIFNYL